MAAPAGDEEAAAAVAAPNPISMLHSASRRAVASAAARCCASTWVLWRCMNLRFMILLEMVDMVKKGGYLSPASELCVGSGRAVRPRRARVAGVRTLRKKPADKTACNSKCDSPP